MHQACCLEIHLGYILEHHFLVWTNELTSRRVELWSLKTPCAQEELIPTVVLHGGSYTSLTIAVSWTFWAALVIARANTLMPQEGDFWGTPIVNMFDSWRWLEPLSHYYINNDYLRRRNSDILSCFVPFVACIGNQSGPLSPTMKDKRLAPWTPSETRVIRDMMPDWKGHHAWMNAEAASWGCWIEWCSNGNWWAALRSFCQYCFLEHFLLPP